MTWGSYLEEVDDRLDGHGDVLISFYSDGRFGSLFEFYDDIDSFVSQTSDALQEVLGKDEVVIRLYLSGYLNRQLADWEEYIVTVLVDSEFV